MTQTLDRPQTVEVPTRVRTLKSLEEEAVLNGVAWMDEHFPTWEWRIDLDRLDLTSDANCILGQVFGDAYDVFRVFHMTFDDAQHLGFAGWPSRYDQTVACWCRIIKERRGEVV